MRQLDVSICVIRQGEQYLLQKRGDDPRIGAAGLIGAFGGKIEPNETPIAAACRELGEETTLTPTPDNLVELGRFAVISDHRLEAVTVNTFAFLFEVDMAITVAASEGEITSFTLSEAMANLGAMTPATRTCFETIIGKES